MLSTFNRVGAALLMAAVAALLMVVCGAPYWAVVGLAWLTYFHVINAASVYNAHWSIINRKGSS